jgi:hypothetical protein
VVVNWSWPKATALTTVQSIANSFLTLLIGHSLFEIDWWTSLGIAGATGLTTFLRAVVAYGLPAGLPTTLISATVGAAQDAAAGSPVATDESAENTLPPAPSLFVHDVRGARG